MIQSFDVKHFFMISCKQVEACCFLPQPNNCMRGISCHRVKKMACRNKSETYLHTIQTGEHNNQTNVLELSIKCLLPKEVNVPRTKLACRIKI